MEIESTLYDDFPAIEWVMRVTNRLKTDSPILENILPLDVSIPVPPGRPPTVVHYAKGALASLDDFAPVNRTLEPGSTLHLQPGGGRSSSEVMPFFNIDLGGEGIIVAVGWTGEWAVDFCRDRRGELQIKSGMAGTHLKLHPGETIRTPRILVLFWHGESVRGNNLLRRFLLAHHRPRAAGKPLTMPVVLEGWGGTPYAGHQNAIDRVVRHDLPIQVYWIDAEWFGRGTPWWKYNGDWQVRPDLYPQGFRPLADALHRSGRQFLLWFEPERVCRDTPWAKLRERPGWLLELHGGKAEYKQHNCDWGIPHDDPRWVRWESHRTQIGENDMLFNLGNPAARRFLIDWLSARIDEFGLDWYRQDFNIAPLEFWRGADPPDRRGMTEIRYVEGLYAMWDELLARHPGLRIDNCASGGRRIDLETLSRSVVVTRSDWDADALHNQCHTYGLLSWAPLTGSVWGAMLDDGAEYNVRSAMTAGLPVQFPARDDAAWAGKAKALIEQYLTVQKFFYGDYYPLTPYSQAGDAWMAYQLDLPESGEGLVVVLRRSESRQTRAALRLRAIESGVNYAVADLDTGRVQTRGSERLLREGLERRAVEAARFGAVALSPPALAKRSETRPSPYLPSVEETRSRPGRPVVALGAAS